MKMDLSEFVNESLDIERWAYAELGRIRAEKINWEEYKRDYLITGKYEDGESIRTFQTHVMEEYLDTITDDLNPFLLRHNMSLLKSLSPDVDISVFNRSVFDYRSFKQEYSSDPRLKEN